MCRQSPKTRRCRLVKITSHTHIICAALYTTISLPSTYGMRWHLHNSVCVELLTSSRGVDLPLVKDLPDRHDQLSQVWERVCRTQGTYYSLCINTSNVFCGVSQALAKLVKTNNNVSITDTWKTSSLVTTGRKFDA
jgi:hypothetical protein